MVGIVDLCYSNSGECGGLLTLMSEDSHELLSESDHRSNRRNKCVTEVHDS